MKVIFMKYKLFSDAFTYLDFYIFITKFGKTKMWNNLFLVVLYFSRVILVANKLRNSGRKHLAE